MRVVVAMSGGVDSSVAAALMKDAGHDVIGVALKLWEYPVTPGDAESSCCSPDDLYDARRVAQSLGIPFYVIDHQEVFRRSVVDGFVASYLIGRTPNPCVQCNNFVKFDRLLELTRELGGEALATGHYARIFRDSEGRFGIRKALDLTKDQSYFLFGLDQRRLGRIVFPLSEWTKAKVRETATALGLPTASKHESQELCFVPANDYAAFLEENGVDRTEGDIVDTAGTILGRHQGLHRYTIGQRKGLGIAHPQPLYVVELDVASNRVIVGEDRDLFSSALLASGVTWIRSEPDADEVLSARIRYRARDVGASLSSAGEGTVRVQLASVQRAITPGQAIVFYQGDELRGGGWIETPLKAGVDEEACLSV